MVDESQPDADALYDSAPCGLLLARADGGIVRANATVLGWLGYGAAELVGRRTVADLLTTGGRIFQHTHVTPLLQMQGSVAELKLDVICRDGSTLPMLVNILRRKHGGQVFDEFAMVVVRDRHRYEQELLKARKAMAELNDRLSEQDRRRSEFIATLAHELRNPLTPIRTGLEILARADLPDTAVRARGMMQRQMHVMVRLIEDLMDISRISTGKLELRTEVVGVAPLVESALEASRPAVAAAGHQLAVSLPAEPLWVEADPVRLAQVISNVVNNAAKYTPRGGRIEILVAREDAQVAIRVRDNGAGIDPSKLATVFQMFAQIDNTLKASQGGLGIGLALARSLTKMHGGTLTAESEGVGKGSTFAILLPLCREAPKGQIAQGTAASLASTPLRVLLVDDDPDNLASMAMLLELDGHEVRSAGSGAECMALSREFSPDVALLDIGLPDIDGYALAGQLRSDPRHKKIILAALTGWGAPEDKRRSEASGFDRHFTKPPSPESLREFLADCAKAKGCAAQ